MEASFVFLEMRGIYWNMNINCCLWTVTSNL